MTDGTGLANVPKFEDLPAVDGTERHSWDVFGRDDEVGTVNFMGRSRSGPPPRSSRRAMSSDSACR